MTEGREKRQNKYKGWKGPFRDRLGKWRMYHRATKTPIDCVKFEPYSLPFDMEVHRINELYKAKETKPGTLGMLIKKYRASPRFQKRKARTQKDYQAVFDWLQPIEDTPLERFTRGFVAKLRDKAEQQRKFRFANHVRSVLSLVFNWALEYEYVKANPVEAVSVAERPKSLPDANRPWTDAERYAVLSALPLPMLGPMSLMMFYGLDPQDALGLPKTAVTTAGIDTRRHKTGQPVYLPLFEPGRMPLRGLRNMMPSRYAPTAAASRGPITASAQIGTN